MGIKRLRTNNEMYCNTALCKSSFVSCVVAIARYKGSLQYVFSNWPGEGGKGRAIKEKTFEL